MLKKLFICSTLALSFVGYSQNLDPTKLFTVDYSVPPRVKDYVEAKTFCVELQNSQNLNVKTIIESELNPNYYSIVAERAISDIYIKVSSSTRAISDKKYSSTSTTKTDSKGRSYVETTHTFTGTHKFSVMIEMFNKAGSLIKSRSATKDFTVTSSSTDKNSSDNKYNTDYNSLEGGAVKNGTLEAFWGLESEYFYALETTTVTPIKVKSRKFDYTDMNEAADLVTTWLTNKNFTLDDEGIKKAIGIYEAALTELNAEEKKVRVNSEIGAVCNYMLASINFHAKNYTKAHEQIQISEGLDKRIHFTQEMLKDTCQKLKDKGAF